MVIKNYELIEYCRVFGNMVKSTAIKDINQQYKIFKIHKDLIKENQTLTSFRQQLERKYFVWSKDKGIEFDENNIPKLKPEMTMDDYITGLNELLMQTVDIDFRGFKIILKDLQPMVDAGELVAKDFIVLQSFVVENENE